MTHLPGKTLDMESHQARRSGDVARQLSESIRLGTLAPGAYLPSARKLAGRFGVSVNTIQIAIRELETRRLVQCLPRKGTRVCETLPAEDPAVVTPDQTKTLVGIIGPDYYISNLDQWTPRILHAAEESLFQSSYRLSLLPGLTSGPNAMERILARLTAIQGSLAGVICMWDDFLFPLLDELDRRKLPWVTINRPHAGFSENFVAADNGNACRRLGRGFATSGYERLLIISHALSYLSAMEKVTGLYQGYLESRVSTQGIQVVVAEGSADEMSGYRAVKALLRDPLPQAIFATGDHLALGAIHALQEAGIAIPKQVNVVGSTGLHRAEQSTPSLSVVAQPMEEIGAAAADLLHQMICSQSYRIAGRQVPCKVILRESCHLKAGIALAE